MHTIHYAKEKTPQAQTQVPQTPAPQIPQSFLLFIAKLNEGKIPAKEAFDRLYESLLKESLTDCSYHLSAAIGLCCYKQDTILGEYWPKLRLEVIKNLKQTKDKRVFLSERKIGELTNQIGIDTEIRNTIADLQKKAIKKFNYIN